MSSYLLIYGRPASVLDNEKWLHRPDVQAELNEAIAWAEKNPPEDTNFEELEARIKR
jgi:hypothetical protein